MFLPDPFNLTRKVTKLIYKPDWLHSHASYPTPFQLDSHRISLFFSARDQGNRSHIGVMDMLDGEIISQPRLVLAPGEPGDFDQNGLTPACVIDVEGDLWLYYLGWQVKKEVPFQNQVGLAICKKGENSFQKHPAGPLLGINDMDHLSLSYPFVLREQDGFKMWYGSHLSWEADGFPMKHVIKYAHSEDGIHWQREGHICLDVTKNDYAFARPWVIPKEEGYEMYYCFRGASYQIGYAISADGLRWERKDHLLELGEMPGWAKQMQCYPSIATIHHQKVLFFNGNQYGQTGIGMMSKFGNEQMSR